jgi:calcium-activated chloride channel regulator 4
MGHLKFIIFVYFQYSKIQRLYQHAKLFLEEAAPQRSYIGIVTFSTDASTQSNLVELNDNSVQELVTSLPRTVTGSTCIGC